jgi:hypothetical protein
MRCLAIVLTIVAAAIVDASAATITVTTSPKGVPTISIAGHLRDDDEKVFRDTVSRFEDKENIIVTLDSPGGDAFAVGIGDIIWRAGMATMVPADKTCASTCALIWLAAPPERRYIGKGAYIGFHGAYDESTGQPGALMNALWGAYLGHLHFSYDAIIWMLSARPLAMHKLTQETAKQYDIFSPDLENLSNGMAEPQPPPPSTIPRQAEAQPLQQPPPSTPPRQPEAQPLQQEIKRSFHVVNAEEGHLNIRKGPGPNYDLVAEMPLGETGLVGKCVPLDGGYLPFCEVEWRGTTGWASSCCISVQQPEISANGLDLFCANKSGLGYDDGVIVQATKSNTGWRLHVTHKVGGQLYDRNVQYEIFAFRQSKRGPPNYYWDGVLIKDRNVLMTGHLWLDTGVWLYNEYVSYQDGSQPVKTATSTIACQQKRG